MRQIAHTHSPGLANRRGASGKWDIFKMTGALEARIAGEQRFAAPDSAIGAIPGSIEREADDSPVDGVFRHATGNMRVVVLHADQDRKSTRLNSSHLGISYAVFCL